MSSAAGEPVSVAIPVLDGMPRLKTTIDAVLGQQLDSGRVELVVADSGSQDGSRELAVQAGARVVDIAAGEFSHGGTRNALAAAATGSHIAFLTQDSVPADAHWLQRLLDGFALAPGIGLVFGPYRPESGASPMVARELSQWFASFAPDGRPRVDRPDVVPADRAGRNRRAFFTDANGCVARRAWEAVPFRPVAYAEDQMLARDALAAGWAKAYHPDAAVEHSHEYGFRERVKRSFDEARALREVHGQKAHGGARRLALVVQRDVRDDLDFLRADNVSWSERSRVVPASVAHHTARALGATLGSRADRLPPSVRRRLSLEHRSSFEPQT